MGSCKVRGCSLEVSGYSYFCDSHKRKNRRHGHPDQKPVTSRELEPYRERVRQRIKKNEDSRVWSLLDERWQRLSSVAVAEVEGYLRGVSSNRYRVDAMSSIRKLGVSVLSQEIIEVVLAMYLLEDSNPNRFKSHEAFGRQIVRRVRALADVNVGSYYDHKSGAIKKVYRDAKPKTTAILADLLQSTFGATAISVAALERQDDEVKQNEQLALNNALSELT